MSNSSLPFQPWEFFIDGSSSKEGSGAGVLLIISQNFEVQQSIKFEFAATNNCSKYEALLSTLRLAEALTVQCLYVYSDSQLVVNQVLGNCCTKSLPLLKYLEETRERLLRFKIATLQTIPREGITEQTPWTDLQQQIPRKLGHPFTG